jgi:hypothetical protein
MCPNTKFQLALSFALCAIPSFAPAKQGPERQGEAYTFALRFLGSVEAGRARLAISPPVPKSQSHIIRIAAEAEALGLAKALTGLHENYRLELDSATFLPRSIILEETGWRVRSANVVLDGKTASLTIKRPQGESQYKALMPSEPLEPLSVLLLLRALRLHDGDEIDLVLLDGSAFYQGTMQVVGREEVLLPFGAQKAIKLACKGERISIVGHKIGKPPRYGTVWVSDDKARIPLRIEGETELGKAEFVLTSVEKGRKPLPLPQKIIGLTQRPFVPGSRQASMPPTSPTSATSPLQSPTSPIPPTPPASFTQ